MKDNLYEIVKNMPKDEALDFLDKYKDGIKYKNLSQKRCKAIQIKEIIRDLEIWRK